MNRQPEREWRDYRADVSATRAIAAIKLAPHPLPAMSPRARKALARARKRTSAR